MSRLLVVIVMSYIFVEISTAPSGSQACTWFVVDAEAGGFWYGTQTMSCVGGAGADTQTGKSAGALLSIMRSRRSLDYLPPPTRADSRYIHRLLYYRGHVFEWGSGTRGYHVGPTASVTTCPVTWEAQPAGHSQCDVERLIDWTEGYQHRYGGYNVLVNNCHQFANRAVAFLLTCPQPTPNTKSLEESEAVVEYANDHGGPSAAMRSVWKLVKWLSAIYRNDDADSE